MIRLPPRLTRPAVAFTHDIAVAALSFWVSLYLRLGDSLLGYSQTFLALATTLFTVIAGIVFWRLGLHRGIWRYASLNDLIAIARAAMLVMLIFLAAMFVTTRLDELPRSLVFINWFVLTILLAAPRILYRHLKDGRLVFAFDLTPDKRVPVLLAGAGDAAEMFIQATESRREAEYRVVGILDESPMRVGRFIGNIKVLGNLGDLHSVVDQLRKEDLAPQRLIVTKDNIAGPALARLVDDADQMGLNVARLPRLTEFQSAHGGKLAIRPIDIADILGRPQAVLDRDAMKALIAGKRILVTGAGGTIGSELVRQIAGFGPAHIVLLDNAEWHLYTIDLELAELNPQLSRSSILADVRDGARINSIFAAERPDVVFHAAALKHVHIVEAHPCDGVLTNVIGTRHISDACCAYGTAAMVLISTDKAVNPSSVMGATKRLAESWCQSLDILERERGGKTRFVTVRFGNVLGSTGSVVPLFQRQLAAGGPLTVTDPSVSRYFMTTREAVELVLQASAQGAGVGAAEGARGDRIYVLDMGKPIKIVDLARRIIRLAGLQPDRDIKIVFTGLRPGEKLNEELFHAAEALQNTATSGILLASPRVVDQGILAKALDEIAAGARAGNTDVTLACLRRLVPEFDSSNPAVGAGRRSALS